MSRDAVSTLLLTSSGGPQGSPATVCARCLHGMGFSRSEIGMLVIPPQLDMNAVYPRFTENEQLVHCYTLSKLMLNFG